MNRAGVVAVLWAACAFVVWNVIYDRYLAIAALEFTREQILRHERGEAVTSIHAGFSPRVQQAAWQASAWVAPILVAGGAATWLTARRGPRRAFSSALGWPRRGPRRAFSSALGWPRRGPRRASSSTPGGPRRGR